MATKKKAVRVAVQFNQRVWQTMGPEEQKVVVDHLADQLRTELTFFAPRLEAAYGNGGRPADTEREGLFSTVRKIETWSWAIAALGWYVSEMEEMQELRKRLYALNSAPVSRKKKRKGR